jgi:hypothetical protein
VNCELEKGEQKWEEGKREEGTKRKQNKTESNYNIKYEIKEEGKKIK